MRETSTATNLSYGDDTVDNFGRDSPDVPMLDLETDRTDNSHDLRKTSDDCPPCNLNLATADPTRSSPMTSGRPVLGFSDRDVGDNIASGCCPVVPSGETVRKEQDAVQPNAGNAVGMTADEGGERRDLPYILYRACHAIGQDAPYPALTPAVTDEYVRDDGDTRVAGSRGHAIRRGSSSKRGKRRANRPSLKKQTASKALKQNQVPVSSQDERPAKRCNSVQAKGYLAHERGTGASGAQAVGEADELGRPKRIRVSALDSRERQAVFLTQPCLH